MISQTPPPHVMFVSVLYDAQHFCQFSDFCFEFPRSNLCSENSNYFCSPERMFGGEVSEGMFVSRCESFVCVQIRCAGGASLVLSSPHFSVLNLCSFLLRKF